MSYKPKPNEPYQYVTHPARCNRRDCQARRNLSKHPALYKNWPRCHVCRSGKMYVDWYRMKKGPRDNAPVCNDTYCQYAADRMAEGGRFLPFHRVSTKGCSGYESYVIERTLADSRHSPIKPHDGDDAPF